MLFGMKNSFLFFSFSVVLFLLSGCSFNETSTTSTHKSIALEPLIVGFSADYPPLVFQKDSSFQGVEVEFAHAIAKVLHRKIIFKNMKWKALYSALENGEIDVVMSGVSVTSYRKDKVLFTKPYLSISQMALMREGESGLDIAGEGIHQSVGVVEYTTSQKYSAFALSKATQHIYPSAASAISALMSKEIDFYIADSPAIWYYTSKNPIKGLMGYYVPMTQENLAWALKKDNIKLQNELNSALASLEKNSISSQIISKWIQYRVMQPAQAKIIHF